jgi:hypothetical protein
LFGYGPWVKIEFDLFLGEEVARENDPAHFDGHRRPAFCPSAEDGGNVRRQGGRYPVKGKGEKPCEIEIKVHPKKVDRKNLHRSRYVLSGK